MTAGPDGIRGPGPNQFAALLAATHYPGFPDPRRDQFRHHLIITLRERKTSTGRRSVARHGCGTVDVATGENRPGGPGHLVGERNGSDEIWTPGREGP
jgi:hypothetical protein